MIQPSWDNLAESTQRVANGPSLSQQLQEAYEAGYNRALQEGDIGDDWGPDFDILRWDLPGWDKRHPNYEKNQRASRGWAAWDLDNQLKAGYISQEEYERQMRLLGF